MSVTIHEGGPTPERVHAAFLQAAEQQMNRAIAEVHGEVVRRAPFRTGHLRRSITFVVRREGTRIVGFLGSALSYAPFLEFGTGLYGPRNRLIVPVRAQALRFPAGGRASVFAGGSRAQGSAGPGFRLSGSQRSGTAGGSARYVFARSVKGVHPLRFFADGIEISRGRVHRTLSLVPTEARRILAGGHA